MKLVVFGSMILFAAGACAGRCSAAPVQPSSYLSQRVIAAEDLAEIDSEVSAFVEALHFEKLGLTKALEGPLTDAAKARVCYVLGRLRADGAVPALLANISLRDEGASEIEKIPRWFFYPCAEAIIRIGPHAIRFLIDFLGVHDRGPSAGLALDVLSHVSTPCQAEEALEKAIREAKKARRKNLELALSRFKAWEPGAALFEKKSGPEWMQDPLGQSETFSVDENQREDD